MANDLDNKYRPKKLQDVIGQHVAVQCFTNAFKSKNLHHAYILAGKFGCGKCVEGDSLVLLNNNIVKIKSIVPNIGNESVCPIDLHVVDEKGKIGRSSLGYYQSDARVVSITTRDGFSITGTPEHPIRVINKKGQIVWRKLGRIKKGDFCAIFRHPSLLSSDNLVQINWVFDIEKYIQRCHDGEANRDRILCQMKQYKIPTVVEDNFAKLAGYFASEGYFGDNDNCVSISNADCQVLNNVVLIVKKLFGYDASVTPDKRNSVKNVRIDSAYISEFLHHYGISGNSFEKSVPDIILLSPRHIIKSFLSCYFEGDGYVELNRGAIGCCSVSRKLLQQIQIILLEFGIVSTLHPKNGKCNGKKYVSWRLSITSDNIAMFNKYVGFLGNRKRNEAASVEQRVTGNPNIDVIPYVQGIALSLRKILRTSNGKFFSPIANQYVLTPKWNSNIGNKSTHLNLTYKNMRDIVSYFEFFLDHVKPAVAKKIKTTISTFKSLIDLNYFYSPVDKISQGRTTVYDICKDGTDKSFICNGFISHNTTVARIVAAMENCQKGPTLEPCGVCDNCVGIFSGKSMDVQEIDGGSCGNIDNIRSVRQDVQKCPIFCRVKYIIIDEAHRLTGAAADSALKMIEEPPEDVRFMLCTTDPHMLKETVHSRCITIRFSKVPWMDLHQHLTKISQSERLEIEEGALRMAAKYAKGSVRNALVNLQGVMNYAGSGCKVTTENAKDYLSCVEDKQYYNLVDSIVSIDMPKAIVTIDRMLRDGKEADQVMSGFWSYMRNLLLAKTCPTELQSMGFLDNEVKELEHQSKTFPMRTLLHLFNLAKEINRDISYNIDLQVLLEEYVVRAVVSIEEMKKMKS